MNTKTKSQYRKLIRQFIRWRDAHRPGVALQHLTQSDVDDYELYLIYNDLAPATLNNHRQAINALGHSYRLSLVSVPASAVIETIPPEDVAAIIAAVPEFYRAVLSAIYAGHVPPGVACGAVLTPRNTLSLQTVNNRLRAACDALGLRPCSAKKLHQSGIVHALRRGVNRDELMAAAKIGAGTLARYIKAA